jgi:hypothetical protein
MLGGIHNCRSRCVIAKRVTSWRICNFLVTKTSAKLSYLPRKRNTVHIQSCITDLAIASRREKWSDFQTGPVRRQADENVIRHFIRPLQFCRCPHSILHLQYLGARGYQRSLTGYCLEISLCTGIILNRLRISCLLVATCGRYRSDYWTYIMTALKSYFVFSMFFERSPDVVCLLQKVQTLENHLQTIVLMWHYSIY